ncbi:hypothetical protein DdX_14569 [Ditylenchus destructor]|uniref:Uncharacterized protein n=1 Tax=Ditylenchus destructor TaxID=166010 RepID=A0AAD4R1T3_9BILA|nr:hypothetical protein DdX_14569 [Ditylenchus destructor]
MCFISALARTSRRDYPGQIPSSGILPEMYLLFTLSMELNFGQPKEHGSLNPATLLFDDLPLHFLRFQNVSIHFELSKYLPNFLESWKHSFVGSKLNIETIVYSEMVTTQTLQVLNNNLLDLYSIRFACSGFSPDRFLPTTGVLNCDKVTFFCYKMSLTSDMKVALAKWLHWKQGHKNSRRHLILECHVSYDIFTWLKKEFVIATNPTNFVISFVQCMDYIPSLIRDMQFCLENKETGERLTMFKYPGEENRKMTFRMWRRIPVEDDNQKNLDAEQLRMLSGQCEANENFDRDFYDF